MIGREVQELRERFAGILRADDSKPFLPHSSAHRHVEALGKQSVTVARPDPGARLVTAKVPNYQLPAFDLGT